MHQSVKPFCVDEHKEWLLIMVKVKPVQLGKTERMSFSKIDEVIDMPQPH